MSIFKRQAHLTETSGQLRTPGKQKASEHDLVRNEKHAPLA